MNRSLPQPIMDQATLVAAILANPLSAIVDYYASCLADEPRVEKFLASKFQLTIEVAQANRLGFADRTLGTRLPAKTLRVGKQVRELLIQRGLYKANGRETLRGYVTEPIVNEVGDVIGIRGHKLDPHLKGPVEIVIADPHALASGTEPHALASGSDESGVAVVATHLDAGAVGSQQDAVTLTDAMPAASAVGSHSPLTIADNQITFERDDRRYRIRGLEKNTSTCQMKVSLMASRDGLVHVDVLDLVKARSRAAFIKAAAAELYVDEMILKQDIGQLLLQLETLQAERIAELKRPLKRDVILSEAEINAALELLRDPNLIQRITDDLTVCGVVGEQTNKVVGYLAAVSRKLKTPLAIMIQSNSSAGKTSLMEAILSLVPQEDQIRLSNLSGQSLYYWQGDALKHKILAVSEQEGIAQAAYSLKLLQSEGGLRHATVSKGEYGRMTTEQYSVEGPVALFLTTTQIELDEELLNRCLVLSVDESREQTQAIQSKQRESRTLAARRVAKATLQCKKLHQNAQRLLEPLLVCNPFAEQLNFASNKTRSRRDQQKYLTLIEVIALLHQHQRPILTMEELSCSGTTVTTRYIEVIPSDIVIANRLTRELFGRSLDDLSPQTQTFLLRLQDWVSGLAKQRSIPIDAIRFTRREVREGLSSWSEFQVRTHLTKLLELEIIVPHRGKNGALYVYELLGAGSIDAEKPFLAGLVEPS